MAKEDVLKSVEEVIRAAKLDIKKKPTSDKIRQFTGLINCYTRLSTQSEALDGVDDGYGDPNFYASLMGEKGSGAEA
ncbi:hypothetical protein OAH46_01135 [Verrucomicrobia bacterium]|nr:hypothetical protein [Verrucomicrobiota bacterium]